MVKIMLKNLLYLWLTLFTTNLIIFFMVIGFKLDLGILQHLYFFNMLFWGLQFGSKAGKEMREFKDGQNSKRKDDKRDSE